MGTRRARGRRCCACAAAAAPPPPRLTEVRVGAAMLDLQRRTLTLADGIAGHFESASEFELLRLFVERPEPTPHARLAAGRNPSPIAEAEAFGQAIDNRVMRLRRKLERDPAKPGR